jgi:2-iminoacetate synthase ThiH
MAGADHGIRKEPAEFVDAIRSIGRIPAERTTTYGRVVRDVTEGLAAGARATMPAGSKQ